MFWFLFIGYVVLFHWGCLWTLTCGGVGGGIFIYGGFMFNFVVTCNNFVSRSAMFISLV
jgi:hypothetical protein